MECGAFDDIVGYSLLRDNKEDWLVGFSFNICEKNSLEVFSFCSISE